MQATLLSLAIKSSDGAGVDQAIGTGRKNAALEPLNVIV